MALGARVGIGLLGAMALLAWGEPSAAQGKELSDRSVNVLMEFAWKEMPDQLRTREGDVVTIDKSKPETVKIPSDVAREVIIAAHRSAHADMCDLLEEEEANKLTLERREAAKNIWSKQQMIYIRVLHTTVVQWLTGTLKITVKDGETVISERVKKPVRSEPCSEADRKKLREQIMAYIQTAPPAAAASAAPPTKRSETTPASQKK